MSKSINFKLIMTVLLTILIALAFMPGLTGTGKVNAAEDWETDYSEYIYLSANETSAQLNAGVIINQGSANDYSFKYTWQKYNDNTDAYETIAETTIPSFNVTGINENQDWKCEVTDKNKETDYQRFYIYKSTGWKIDCLDTYYINKGEAPVLKVKVDFDPGCNAANLGLKYKWSKWNKDSGEYADVAGSSDSLALPAINGYSEYKCEVTDSKNNKKTVWFDIRISPSRAPMFKVAFAIQNLKDPDELTLADKGAVMAAKAAYDGLSASQKKQLDNEYSGLKKQLDYAVRTIEKLQGDSDIAALKYNDAVKAAKAKTVTKLKLKAVKGKKIKVSWKGTKDVSGYQVIYSKKKNFKGAKKVLIKKATIKKVTLKKLKKGKKYFVKVRPFTKINEPQGKAVQIFGGWSPAGKIKAKK